MRPGCAAANAIAVGPPCETPRSHGAVAPRRVEHRGEIGDRPRRGRARVPAGRRAPARARRTGSGGRARPGRAGRRRAAAPPTARRAAMRSRGRRPGRPARPRGPGGRSRRARSGVAHVRGGAHATARPVISGWTMAGIPRQRCRARSVTSRWAAEQRERVPVAPAARGHRRPRARPARAGERAARGLGGADVLDEEQRSRRGESTRRSSATREPPGQGTVQRTSVSDDGVEARVGERQRLGRPPRIHRRCRPRAAAGGGPSPRPARSAPGR